MWSQFGTTRTENDSNLPEYPLEIWWYDWVTEYYKLDMKTWTWNSITESVIKEKVHYHRFTINTYLTNLIWTINLTFQTEQPRLVSKEIRDCQNRDALVQIDFPQIKNEEEMNKVLTELEFSNKYIIIDDEKIAFKIKTRYLNNRKHLEYIWMDILKDQVLEAIQVATFSPKVPFKVESKEYKEMIKKYRKPYVLFSNISIQQIWNLWYVVLDFTEEYKKTVIIPQNQEVKKKSKKTKVTEKTKEKTK